MAEWSQWRGAVGPPEAASLRALLTVQTRRSLQRKGVRLHPTASSRLTVAGERPLTGEDSPPSNGRIQYPRDVCGTKNQSPIVVIPHPCGEREQTLTQNTCKDRSHGQECEGAVSQRCYWQDANEVTNKCCIEVFCFFFLPFYKCALTLQFLSSSPYSLIALSK